MNIIAAAFDQLHQLMPNGPSLNQFAIAVFGVIVLSAYLTFRKQY